jgi:PhzF family phenazine biosynthesis protein
MTVRYFHVDAFASAVFSGNPAGVCLLDAWLPDATLQRMAAEHRLSETAFIVRSPKGYELRWYTPTVEVDLCGHATLAAAHVLFVHAGEPGETVEFRSQSGVLRVHRRGGGTLALDFPSRPAGPCPVPEALAQGLGRRPIEVLKSRDYLAVFAEEDEVRGLAPDMAALASLDCAGVIATAPGRDRDFVSRFFAPQVGIPEDPVTGSAHCTLVPYWSRRLGRKRLEARQVSARGGELSCEDVGERVLIGGRAVTYLRGEIELPNVPVGSWGRLATRPG